MSSQAAFLETVRRALGQKPLNPTASTPVPSPGAQAETLAALHARLAAQRPGLLAQLRQELSAVGGTVVQVSSVAEATGHIVRLVQEKGARLVARWPSTLLEGLGIDAALRQQGVVVQVTELPPTREPEAMARRRREMRQVLAEADMGVSGVDYVIAETGSLVLAAHAGQMRGVSLLPPVHVAVARAEQVVASMEDYLLLVQAADADLQRALTSCISFITGPSRSGDIELTLAVGVHGPGELHLLVLDAARDITIN